jgi:hypothetical protein
MMHAVRGIYRGGVIELLERPEVAGDAEVVVTFLRELASSAMGEAVVEIVTAENARPLEDFEPIVPMKPVRLSDLVLEDRG